MKDTRVGRERVLAIIIMIFTSVYIILPEPQYAVKYITFVVLKPAS